MGYKILISDSFSEEGIELLKQEKDLQVDYKTGRSEDELAEAIGDYDALIIRSATKVTAKILENAKKLKVISRAGVGTDNIDKAKATEKGVLVMNAPAGNSVSTAEQAMALLLASSRKTAWAASSMREGKWEKKKFKGQQLLGKTIGVIGLGRIGKEVCVRAKGFGMKILGQDPFISSEQAELMGIKLVSLEQIFKEADYITVHTPLTENTKDMITKKEIEMMKKSVILINCARGGIYNEQDVADALNEGRIAAAGFDVFTKEPIVPENPLLKAQNCVCTPHLGASTEEAQVQVAMESAETVRDYLLHGITRNTINFPSIPAEVMQYAKPFIPLCENMGKLLSNFNEGQIKEVKINYTGEMVYQGAAVLRRFALKGILDPILSEEASYINAQQVAEERGIKIFESHESVKDSLDKIQIVLTTDSTEHTVTGTIHGKTQARIIDFDGYEIEIKPEGNFLILSNYDKPGVVGLYGSILGKNGINIAGMYLGRKSKGDVAVVFISVDEAVSEEILQELLADENILKAKHICF